jgi:hypothetical protein
VQEHGAATSRDPRPGIVVYLDQDVVQPVVPPQPVAWFIGRPSEWPVVAAVAGILAPGGVGADPSNRQDSSGPPAAVGPPPDTERAEPAGRGASVPFPLIGSNAGAADRDRDRAMPYH